MHDESTPYEASEELRLWADYYDATTRVLEIMMRAQGTTGSALPNVIAEHTKAAHALQRIKEIRGIKG